jgi:hypothetical protein
MLDWLRMPWEKSDMDDLDDLESNLEAAFRPVEPSPEFVRELRRHLVNFPVPISSGPDSRVPVYIALTIASLLSGVAIIGLGAWIILALLGRLQSHEKRVASSPNLVI